MNDVFHKCNVKVDLFAFVNTISFPGQMVYASKPI